MKTALTLVTAVSSKLTNSKNHALKLGRVLPQRIVRTGDVAIRV